MRTRSSSSDRIIVPRGSVDTLVIFDRKAQGNVKPTRELRTPHGTYAIAVDEESDRLYASAERSVRGK